MQIHQRLREVRPLPALPPVPRVHERPGERDAEVDVVRAAGPLDGWMERGGIGLYSLRSELADQSRPDKNVDLLSCLRAVCSTIGQKQ